ncbi:MAG: EAL domain-containing protein [Solobacterium sp.]|nr:EAL domain-containing protein [Solobacterium sp.]
MPENHKKFHAANGKRTILVADDEMINRELLGGVLRSEYEVITAQDGEEAIRYLTEKQDTISLVLLDLLMPKLTGFDVLNHMRQDPVLRKIPAIVITSDQSAEIECLQLGAIDFIPKPYPQPGVILARVLKTIELFEDRDIIQYTERDTLTGLYNKEYFYRYATQYDQHHKDKEMDAIVLDVNHFHMINERYGKAYGDEVLRRIGEKVREIVRDSEGIVCRRENDTFLVYCPHREDYESMLENASIGLAGDERASNRVRLRMGIYSNADKSIDIERRFDRAKLAADTIRNSYTKQIALYDNKLHESQLYTEQLLEDFHDAIETRQFKVFFQPKFDIRPKIPVLTSAEALVRWFHPALGMISPGIFIPLFEENGLIRELDNYVWRQTAEQIRHWKDKFDFSVPVSVNVSRIDMYDPNLIDNLLGILKDSDLKPNDLLLEITESAYTQDSTQMIQVVEHLRELGFRIEMDDFGTGYSSLNMISKLPIDALKLDMMFIRSAFSNRRDTRMIEVIIDIADYLSVPVIAEGVETQEQLEALKAMGCDIVQGYYFSKPVPSDEYEHFIVEKKKNGNQADEEKTDVYAKHGQNFGRIFHALTSGFESIYYVDTKTNHYVEFSSHGRHEDLQIERSGLDFFGDTQRNLPKIIYKDDVERVCLSMQKETLLDHLRQEESFSMTYRLIMEDNPAYYNLKVVRASADDDHIVVGISNVDESMKQARDDEETKIRSTEFFNIAQTLSHDFESIYYVDLQTDEYREFTAQGAYKTIPMELSGRDFFKECQRNLLKVVYSEDQERLSAFMQKEVLLKSLQENKVIFYEYHLMIDDKPVPFRMKIVMSDDENYIIIGVSNISAQIAQEKEFEEVRQNSVTYSSIAQALSADYFSIYYVNTETDEFIEYNAKNGYESLGFEKKGDDFFTLSRKNIQQVIYSEDCDKFLNAFQKDKILNYLRRDKTFTINYRLMLEGVPTYVSMKIIGMDDENDPHIVVGINNIDAQMKREHELGLAREMVNRDALTGVKSKHAYEDAVKQIDEKIKDHMQEPFAIAFCDVNGLKEMNDKFGHQAGDQFLKDACMIICNIFTHSPVYRIGGDEFLAILRGSDYENRDKLLEELYEINAKQAGNKPTVACGIAVYDPENDTSTQSVFVRADARMYSHKNELKK